MKATMVRLRIFLGLQVVFFVSGLIVIFSTEKLALHLWFNQWHSSLADGFFKNITHLAEGWFIGAVLMIALLFKIRIGVVGLLGIALAGLTTQLLKRAVFNECLRPLRVFEGVANLHFVEGVTLHGAHSFPSGHATGAFALFLFAAWVIKKPWAQWLCLILAILTAYSRVHISQHFFEDIVAGSCVGTITCLAVISLFGSRRWGEKGLLENFGLKPSHRESR